MWIIITTASERIGLGHLVRCSTIRDAVGSAYCRLYIISDWPKDKIKNYIQGDNIFIVSSADTISFGENIKHQKVLIDVETVPESLLFKTKNAKKKLLLGQSGPVTSWANLVVNSAEGNEFINKKWFCQKSNTEYWEGPSYAVLRKPFCFSENNFRIDGKFFIMIGGTDAANIAFNTLRLIHKYFPERKVVAVLNKHHRDVAQIEDWINKKNNTIQLEFHRQDIENLMKQSFCAIVAPGVSLFECLALGIPTIAIAQNERQKRDFIRYPLLISEHTPKKLLFAVNEVCKNPQKWIEYNRSLGSGNKLPELIEWMVK